MDEREIEKARNELVWLWLTKAQHDLASAQILASDPEAYLDTAIFHAQQAAEKAVKGFLLLHGQEFEKTHNLEQLLELALPFEGRFELHRQEAKLLTPYAVKFRYNRLGPDQAEFDRALKAAMRIYAFVLPLLPPEARP